jgi:hypothetical protein
LPENRTRFIFLIDAANNQMKKGHPLRLLVHPSGSVTLNRSTINMTLLLLTSIFKCNH